MKKFVTSTTIYLFSVSLLLVGVFAASPVLGMGPKAENAKIDMQQLSPSVENWFTRQSGPYNFVFVAKDRKEGSLLYYGGMKPREVADHEHAPASTRIKFYASGENKWDMRSDPGSDRVEIRTLPLQIEQWITETVGQFRALVVIKADGTLDVFRPRNQEIQHVSKITVLVNQSDEPVANISVHPKPGSIQPMPGKDVYRCICINGTWFWWPGF